MDRKNWIWIISLIVIVLVNACTSKAEPTDPLVGTLAPAFQLDNALGGQVSLNDYTKEGTPVLLFFHMAVG